MKETTVGDYYAGNEVVRLNVRDGWGGEFFFTGDKCKTARIVVGLGGDWENCLSILLHEILELMLERIKCRFSCSNEDSRILSNYLFVASHSDFSDVCSKTAEFINESTGDFRKVFKEYKKKK